MAYTITQLQTFFTNVNAGTGPTAAQLAGLQGIANQNATGALSDSAALQAVINLGSDNTTAVSVETYQFFLGFAPSQAGLASLNAAYTGSGIQANMNGENRFIAQSISLATSNATAKAAFSAAYGTSAFASTADAARAMYNTIIGNAAASAAGINIDNAIAFLTSTASLAYYNAFVKANVPGLTGADVELAVRAAIAGEIMYAATSYSLNGGSYLGSYATATNNLMLDLVADGVLTANNASGINIFTSYGSGSDPTAGKTVDLTVSATDILSGSNGNDTFIGQWGQTTTLQASDNISAGGGTDVFRVVTDINPTGGNNTFAANVQGFTVSGVEVLEVQAQNANGTTLGLENVDSALTTVRSSSSNAAVTVKNVGQVVELQITNALNAANVTLAYKAAAVAGTADTQKIALNGNTVGVIKIGTNVDDLSGAGNTGIETVAITSLGAASTVTGLDTAAKTLTVEGDKNLTITTALNAAVTTVTAGTFTGALNITTGASSSALSITTGSGADTVNLSANTGKSNVSTGDGNDTILLGANYTGDDTVSGGAGTDTVSATSIASVAAAKTFANTTSVETLGFTAATAGTLNAGAYNATTNAGGTSAVTAGVVTYDFQDGINGAVALNNVADAASIKINAKAAATGTSGNTLDVTNGTDGTADSVSLAITVDTSNYALGKLTAKHETLNLSATDTTGAVQTVTVAEISDADLATLNISGNAKVVVTNTIVDGALTTVNAGTNTGGVSLKIDDASDISSATAQNVSVTTGSGADTIQIGGANNFGAYTIVSGNGDDNITVTSAGAAKVTHTITAGNATVETTEVLSGTINVVGGADTKAIVTAGAGSWTVNTAGGADSITTGSGNDVINSGNGNDTISAGAGNDTITVGVGVVSIDGGDGDDTFNFTAGELTSADSITGGAGTDKLVVTGAAAINDSAFNNWVGVEQLNLDNGSSVTMNAIANAKSFNTVNLSGGTNTVVLGEGFTNNLTVNLAGGNDTISAATAPGAVTVNVSAANLGASDFITGGTSANDVVNVKADNSRADLSNLSAVETVNAVAGTVGTEDVVLDINSDAVIAANGSLVVSGAGLSKDADLTVDASDVVTATKKVVVTGGAGNDKVYGGAGADSIDGGAGADVLFGGAGADQLTGGAGADQFTYSALAQSSSSKTDTITDFATGVDTVVVDNGLLGGALNFAGNYGSFGAAQGATKNGDGIIDYVFQQDTNTLWVDLNDDGTLNADDLQIKLTGVTALKSGDVTNGTVLTSSAVTFNGTVASYNATKAGLTTNDLVTVTDTSANLNAATLSALLADTKVDNIDSTENGVALVITTAERAVASNMAKLNTGDTITVSDTTANIQANLAAAFADAKVDNIDSTEATAINITVAQEAVVANMAKLNTGDTITVSDTSANIGGSLTTLLADAKVDNIDSTQDGVAFNASVANVTGVANLAKLQTADTINVSDTTANIQGSLVALLAEAKVDTIDSTENASAIIISVAQEAVAANMLKLQAGDTITVQDTTANIQGALTTLFADAKVDNIDSTEATAIAITVAQEAVVANMAKLNTGDTITVSDTSAAIGGALTTLLADAKVDNIDSTEDGVAFNASVANVTGVANLAKLQAGDTINVADTTSTIQGSLVALLAEAKVDTIDSSENSTAILITAAQEAVVANMAKLQAGDTITVSDTTANIQGALVALFADAKVDNIDSTEATAITISVAQEAVVANMAKLQAGDTITVSDTSANISGSLTALLADTKVDNIDSTEATAITASVANVTGAANLAKLQASDTITVSDTTANIQGSLAALFAEAKVDNIDSTEATAITITAAQAIVAGNVAKLAAGDTISVNDTSANIIANLTAIAAEAKFDAINASDNLLNLTAAQFTTLVGGNAVVDGGDLVKVTASTGLDAFDFNDAQLGTATVNLAYTAANQAKGFLFADADASTSLTNGDTFTFASAPDAITNFTTGTDKVDLTTFNVVQAVAGVSFTADGAGVTDGTYQILRGTLAGNVFTYNAAGADALVVWDGNVTGGTVTTVGTVFVGVGAGFTAGDLV